MLFAISGSQGSGKTTVLEELNNRGFPTVKRKTSRSIMDEWGVTLSEVNNDRPLTIKFQDEILKRKLEDEKVAVESVHSIWFTERTYADLFTYALIAIGKDNEYNDWVNDYFIRCKKAQSLYKHNFYLPSGKFFLEHDGVRGSNEHYARMVDITMQDVTRLMSQDVNQLTFEKNGPETTNILHGPVEHRADEILYTISKFLG